jgi:TRAP-type C4-dicarboxylate transport system substrate-binding protein
MESNHSRWIAKTAYPPGTVPAMGLERFAAHLCALTGQATLLDRVHATEMNASGVLSNITSGQIQVGDLYCGGLRKHAPVLALSTRPFRAHSTAAARALAASCRPAYEESLRALGVRLLYMTAWPPTGLWSAQQIESLQDLNGLRLRTYDDLSARVFRGAGAHAVELPIKNAVEQLGTGQLNGILSSGDGAAGSAFREFLPYFYDIRYAIPLCFVVMTQKTYAGLDLALRDAVRQAASSVEQALWDELDDRMQQNNARMTAEGVCVHAQLPDDVIAALQRSALTADEDRPFTLPPTLDLAR